MNTVETDIVNLTARLTPLRQFNEKEKAEAIKLKAQIERVIKCSAESATDSAEAKRERAKKPYRLNEE